MSAMTLRPSNFSPPLELPGKKIIRVIFGPSPPDAYNLCFQFPTLTPSMDCPFPGWTAEIIKMLADYLNWEIEPLILRANVGEVNWGTYVNDSWTGVLGMLNDHKADTTCLLFQYVEELAESFTYSFPVYNVRNVYFAKPKKKDAVMAMWNAFEPYSSMTWIFLMSALFIQGGLATFINWLELYMRLRPAFAPLEKYWQYIRLQVHQGTEEQTPFMLQAGNFSFLIYALLQATIFTNLYTGVLLSALIQKQELNPWNSFEQMVRLIQSGEYKMVVDRMNYDTSWIFKDLQRSNASRFRALHRALDKNPILVTDSVLSALDYVEKGGYIFPSQEDSLAVALSRERCDIKYSLDEQVQKPSFFLFPKNHPLVPEWNQAIQDNESFIRRTFEKYFLLGYATGRIKKCPFTERDIPESDKPLDMNSTFGIFLISMIGYGAAVILFVAEVYFHWQVRLIRLKWRSRKAVTEPVHLMSVARMLSPANNPVQQPITEDLEEEHVDDEMTARARHNKRQPAVQRDEAVVTPNHAEPPADVPVPREPARKERHKPAGSREAAPKPQPAKSEEEPIPHTPAPTLMHTSKSKPRKPSAENSPEENPPAPKKQFVRKGVAVEKEEKTEFERVKAPMKPARSRKSSRSNSHNKSAERAQNKSAERTQAEDTLEQTQDEAHKTQEKSQD
ncbi:Protein W02A2.5 [Aphelenchoides avenae]|nr:Protein W02A2.5 [Aphelenchus avenae]